MVTEDKSRMTLLGILRRIIIMALAAALIVTPVSFMAGCANPFNKEADTDEDADEEDEEEDEDDSSEEESSKPEDASQEEEIDTEDLTIPDMAVSSNIWNVAGRTIVFGRDRIISHDRKSGKNKLIWKDTKKNDDYSESDMSLFAEGTGIVLGDRIYFAKSGEYYSVDNKWLRDITLYSISIDGKDQKSLYTIAGVEGYDQDIAFKDGVIFLLYSTSEYPECLKLSENGDIEESLDPYSAGGFDYDKSEYIVQSVNQNGRRFLFPNIMASECGKEIFVKGYNTLVAVDDKTGEEIEYRDQYPVSAFGDKLLVYHYNSQSNDASYDYGVLDLTNDKYKKLINTDQNLNIFAMDDEYIYYGEPNGMHPGVDFSYLKCDIATGEISALYTDKTSKSEVPNVGMWDVACSYSDGKLYTLLNKDYKLSFVEVDTESGDIENLVEDFYDPGIYDVGSLVYKSDSATHDGHEMISASVSVLQLDDRFPGAAKINKTLMEQADGVMSGVDDSLDECIQWYDESDGEYFIPYELTSDFGYIAYNDGKIINIVQNGYNYYGGAHGMPYWISYVFDLKTGERLYLSDLISITEEDLDEILVEYATKHMNDIGEEYWEGYEETVKQYGGFDSENFILGDDGIDFFYDPYMLASFAGGFQEIVVPYSELNPKFR